MNPKRCEVNFGIVPLGSRQIGRLVVTHTSDESVSAVKSSCGCSAPNYRRLDDKLTEILVELRAVQPGPLSSKLDIEFTGGRTGTVKLSGILVNAISSDPKIITLNGKGDASFVVDWSLAKFVKPTIKCQDDRFTMTVESQPDSKVFTSRVHLAAFKELKDTDLAFITEVLFSVAEGGKEYLASLPLRREHPRVVLPASLILDTNRNNSIKLVIVTDKMTCEGKTGRFQLRPAEGEDEYVIPGHVLKESPSSIVASFSIAEMWGDLPTGDNKMVLEMEFAEVSQRVWKTTGFVFVKIVK
ncbi:MAG: hypothetical protein ABL921_13125 [Pirellula sp.]